MDLCLSDATSDLLDLLGPALAFLGGAFALWPEERGRKEHGAIEGRREADAREGEEEEEDEGWNELRDLYGEGAVSYLKKYPEVRVQGVEVSA